jgi:hypothetical protein
MQRRTLTTSHLMLDKAREEPIRCMLDPCKYHRQIMHIHPHMAFKSDDGMEVTLARPSSTSSRARSHERRAMATLRSSDKSLTKRASRSDLSHNTADMAEKILLAAGGSIPFAMDCISAEGTLKSISNVVSPDGVVAMLLPVTECSSHVARKDVQKAESRSPV